MKITDFDLSNDELRRQMAALLVEGFRENWPEAWPTLEEALDEVSDFEDPERVCRVALDEHGAVLGWIGGMHSYSYVWELHPLVVSPAQQGRGIGRALVADFEERVRERGGLTIHLGTDDESDMTTLSGLDLYPNPWEHLAAIQNLRNHPYTFYQKMGYTITGVVPDANGWGKPDILMSKRVAQPD